MVLTIFVIVLILWGLGIFTGYTMGGVIHDIKEKKPSKFKMKSVSSKMALARRHRLPFEIGRKYPW